MFNSCLRHATWLLCLVSQNSTILAGWWPRDWSSNTSRLLSQPLWTLTNMLTELTDQQTKPSPLPSILSCYVLNNMWGCYLWTAVLHFMSSSQADCSTTWALVGPQHYSSLSLCIGTPQGCVLWPFLYSWHNNCTHTCNTNFIIKFPDDTTVVGLISRGDIQREGPESSTLVCS